MFTFRERLAIKLLNTLRYDFNKEEVIACRHNDRINKACKMLRVNQDKLFAKICKALNATPMED